VDKDLKEYLDNKFSATDTRINMLQDELILLQRESRQVEMRVVDFADARKIFRTETARLNMWTRVAVAAIAAIAMIGNSAGAIIGNQYTAKAESLCRKVTIEEISKAELRNQTRDRELAKAGAREFWAETQTQVLTVTGR
jgi:hypothetical protein